MRKSKQERTLSLAQLGISPQTLRRMAFACGFCVRKSGKINVSDVLVHMCIESTKGTVSHNDMAARIEGCTGVGVSRQAYWERFDETCVLLFQQVLACVIDSKCRARKESGGELLKASAYQRILLQDSTVIQLPASLFAAFSGVKNATSTVCNARIQCVYDLKAGTFVKFTIDPYSKNDFLATLEIDFAKIHRVSEPQLRVLLTARFIMIVVLYQDLFLPLTRLVQATTDRVLSLMKFMRYITRNLTRIPELLNCTSPHSIGFRALLLYCVYDKRQRPNFMTQTERVLAEIDEIMRA